MKKKEKNKVLIWLIIILIVLVLGLVGYIAYDKVFMSDKSNVKHNSTTTTTIAKKQIDKVSVGEIDDADVQYLFDNFIGSSNIDDGCQDYEYNFNLKKEIKFDNLTQKEKLMILINYEHKTNKKLKEVDRCGNEFVEISENELLETSKKIFGNNEIKLDDNFANDFVRFEKSENNTYKAFYIGCFGCEDSSAFYKFLESKKNATSIEIKVAYVATSSDVICDDTEANCKYITTVFNGSKEICEFEDIKNHINELPQYKFIFEKNDDNYVFEKIIKLK